jgi:hypothetical protein
VIHKTDFISRYQWLIVIACLLTSRAGAETPAPEQIEFFETKVRPILVDHCYECHSAEGGEFEAGLALDSKIGWQTGGDSGAAIIPGEPEQSLLIEAIRYSEEVVSGMPPKSKLPADQIAILEHWVSIGAPDPRGEPPTVAAVTAFDLDDRRSQHWSWQPIAAPSPPEVSDASWPRGPIDHFIFAKLAEAGLKPAPPADKRTWLRRVCLDLIGLPPRLDQIQSFLADSSPEAYQRVVTELLGSHHFGEKWARHWLDLVRYSETYGHEFDYPIDHADQYRDYLIRALNADVPYDQFVREQIAGDLIATPRRHPSEDYNESIIGTGFWYFHDATHAPTDVLGNEAEIIANQLDVFGKSVLGLTVACARCHDHKFDAISTADYYALSAYLQSSCRQTAQLDPGRHIETISRDIADHLQRAATELRQFDSSHWDSNRFAAWIQQAKTSPPMLPVFRNPDDPPVWQDFDSPSWPAGWSTTGVAFQPIGDQIAIHADGQIAEPGTVSSRRLGAKQQGILRSPTFEITTSSIHMRVRATADVQLRVVIDNYQMNNVHPLLFNGTRIAGKEADTQGRWMWKSFGGDLQKYVGHNAYLEFVDEGDGYLELDEIRFSDGGQPTESDAIVLLPQSIAELWQQSVERLRDGRSDELLRWLIQQKLLTIDELNPRAGEAVRQAAELAERVPTPLRAIAMAEGTPEEARIYIRGSHNNLGPAVPRRTLEAFGGEPLNRLELADQIASPDNPLTARVIVNRLWHHLFSRGIVASVDDFGPQGEPPSHGELLDFLATDFIQHGWSIKHTIRQIVLSQTYRQASRANPLIPAEQLATIDPNNRLLHRMPVRRLTAEVIRDGILSVSGSLDAKPFGPSVPTHLTSFMAGRGRPGQSGPLDGNGRRSVYLAVTRNFLNPFFQTFDTPSPFGPQGRRSQSNVPAQALALMNDPFVIEQANRWADQILSLPGLDDQSRAALMMEQAHGFPPTNDQATAMHSFLGQQAELQGARDRRAWSDLGHALWNMKAFYYVQ